MENTFLFIAGHPCLDFLNTEKGGIEGGALTELLATPERLADWFAEAGFAPIHPDAQMLTDARALRDAIRALVVAATTGKEAPEDPLAFLNQILETGTARQVLEGTFTVRTELIASHPSPFLPVANAAVDLLTRHDFSLIRQCEGTWCVLWFLDTTKNKQRRWCRMSVCGNREKVAAHYRRHHAD